MASRNTRETSAATPKSAAPEAVSLRANTAPNWANCPSTHCERREECCAPNDCTVKTTGRRGLLPAFKAHMEEENGGPLPMWPEDSFRWSEAYGGLPYLTVMATGFRTFMAGWDAALAAAREHSSPRHVPGEGSRDTP